MSVLVKVLAFIIIFGSVVLLHELGHFLVAKWNDIEVKEFMIGFGPKLLKFQGKETEYSIRLIPLGGAVVMTGEEEEDDSPRSFTQKAIWRRLLVLFAGPFMNFVLAIVLLSILFMAKGFQTNEVTEVLADMPAKEAGIMEGDIITSINSVKIDDWKSLVKEIQNCEGKTLNIIVERNGENKEFKVIPKKNKTNNSYVIGVTSNVKGAGNSFKRACWTTWDISYRTMEFIPKMFVQPKLFDQVSGPVGIATIISEHAEQGIWPLVFLTALISISLGVFNVLPIVPLDGGKAFLLIIELIIRRPLHKKFEMAVTILGFAFVVGLMVFATYKDIAKLAG